MFILKVVHRQTLLRLFLRQEAPINFVNGSMMESMETPSATANPMNVTQLMWGSIHGTHTTMEKMFVLVLIPMDFA